MKINYKMSTLNIYKVLKLIFKNNTIFSRNLNSNNIVIKIGKFKLKMQRIVINNNLKNYGMTIGLIINKISNSIRTITIIKVIINNK